MFKRLSAQIYRVINKTMDMGGSRNQQKRKAAEAAPNQITEEPDEKKSKGIPMESNPPMQGRLDRRRKVALLLSYCGKGYYGIQRNPGYATIEEELLKALLSCELIQQEGFDHPQSMFFQRAARTDKDVSAAGNVPNAFGALCTNLPCEVPRERIGPQLLNKDDIIEKLNEALPPPIRAVAYKRTTKGFNSKNQCSGRTYAYLTPTYAFAPVEKFVTEEYRTTPEIITSVNKILASYIGTHNFHNFTSGVKPEDAKAKRYIISFQCGEPFVEDEIEFAIIRVKGQSFMMHHIRKMVGLMVAIVKGYCSEESLQTAWKPEKMDVPKAPGTGLMLEQLHYDGYNKRFGNDGMHEPIDWSEYQEQIDKFKREYIISEMIKAEKEEKVMMKWLGTLQYHKFDMMDQEDNPWWKMRAVVSPKKRASESEDSPVSEPAQDAPALSSDSVKTKDEPQEKEECNKGDNSEVYMTVETQDSDAKESSAEKDVPLETDSIPETSNSDDVQQDKERLKESAA